MRISDWSSDVCSSDLLAGALTDAIEGGQATRAAIAALAAVVATADGSDVRAQFRAINSTIEHLVRAVSADGAAGANARLSSIIPEHERARVLKHVRWGSDERWVGKECVLTVS